METVAASPDALTVADEAVGFSSLPDLVAVMIFKGLPLDTRLRSREVSSAWCALLEDVSLWTHVDLSVSCGVNPRFLASERLALPLLRTASVRAKGNLQSVDLSGVVCASTESQRWVDAVSVRLGAQCLRVLNLSKTWPGEAFLAPIFEVLRCNAGLVELALWDEEISADFARDVVLPAVRANTCLRKLGGLLVVKSRDAEVVEDPSLQEVEDILEARRRADEDAA